eukprot:TRINITY_DN14685_c0_g1_i1.p2 TRINITY_DN14685_c0_g1~~TRINITY_DN14685_c0_g1_i1.p2  ORF type:complete len:402 (+),score=121.88 TRINITY_DN14685_c0_g1_i1:126-1331(+)
MADVPPPVPPPAVPGAEPLPGPEQGAEPKDDDFDIKAMTNEQLAERIRKERGMRRELAAAEAAAKKEREGLEEVIKQAVAVTHQVEEINLQTTFFEMNRTLVYDEFTAQRDSQRARFMGKMEEVEREMDQLAAQRTVETLRLRDRDLRAKGEYAEKEAVLRATITRHEIDIKALIESVKNVQLGIRLKGKTSAAHRRRLEELAPLYDQQKLDEGYRSYPSSTASGHVPDPSRAALTADVLREGLRRQPSTGAATISTDGTFVTSAPSQGPCYPRPPRGGQKQPLVLDDVVQGHGDVRAKAWEGSVASRNQGSSVADSEDINGAGDAGLVRQVAHPALAALQDALGRMEADRAAGGDATERRHRFRDPTHPAYHAARHEPSSAFARPKASAFARPAEARYQF